MNDIYRHVCEGIYGRVGIQADEAEALLTLLAGTQLYVEIGTLWGGTAVMAAMVCERVITIDIMRGGYWKRVDPCTNMRPTPWAILENLQRFGVAHKVHVLKAASDPWPLPEDVRPELILVDGGHDYDCAVADWRNASRVAVRWILVHDYGSDRHPDVERMVHQWALLDPAWNFRGAANTMAMFERQA